MIVVVEGVNGAGKTTLVRGLSQSLGWPAYRAFRPDDRVRWDSCEGAVIRRELAEIGMSADTHVNDLYFADAAAQCKFNAILDRSLLSAIVYGEERGESIYKEHGKQMMETWVRLLLQAGAVLVLLDISWEFARERLDGDRLLSRDQHDRMQERFTVLALESNLALFHLDVDELHRASVEPVRETLLDAVLQIVRTAIA